MDLNSLAVIAGFIVIYALVSEQFEMSTLTPPMVFVAVGIILGTLGVVDVSIENEIVTSVMEATLIVVLFTDASRIDIRQLRRQFVWPARMLTIGMGLTIALGTLVGWALLPTVGVAGAFVLATVMAPTDAALGRSVVGNPKVPKFVRQTINVESGLNDGLALPILAIALAIGSVTSDAEPLGFLVTSAFLQLGVASAVGLTVGLGGGRLLKSAVVAERVSPSFHRIAGLAMSFLAYGVAQGLNSSGFLAAFVAGAALGATARKICDPIYAFAEAEGELLTLLTFLLFGATVAVPALEAIDLRIVVYVILSLVVLRPVSVAISLIGSGLKPGTVAFLGWFGPRGLATILFGLLVVDEGTMGSSGLIFDVAAITVLFSILLHGFTAAPAANRYGDDLLMKDNTQAPIMPDVPMKYDEGKA